MDLHVHLLAFDGMLGGVMNVELGGVEFTSRAHIQHVAGREEHALDNAVSFVKSRVRGVLDGLMTEKASGSGRPSVLGEPHVISAEVFFPVVLQVDRTLRACRAVGVVGGHVGPVSALLFVVPACGHDRRESN